MQKALDAAVLGGAQKVLIGEIEAKTAVKELSQQNGYSLGDSDIEAIHRTSVKATKTIVVPLTFAKIIGVNDATVSATAKAIVAPLTSARGVVPIAVEKGDVPHKTTITYKKLGSPGNMGFLRIDGNGASDLGEALSNGSTSVVSIGSKIEPKPGNNTGKVREAINKLIKSDEGKPHCRNASTADSSCKRVIVLTIIDTWEGFNGASKKVEIKGFAAYWIEGYVGKSIIGKYINVVTQGEIGSPVEGVVNGLYGVKLVE